MRSRRRRDTTAILLASVALHGVLLVWLIRSMPRPPQAATAALPFEISLVPDLQRAKTRQPDAAPTVAQPARPKTAARNASAHVMESPSQPTPSPTPEPAAAQPAAPAQGVTPSTNTGAGSDADARAAVARALRATLGCSHPDLANLTTAERDACARQTGRQTALGAQENMERVPEEKRVYYAQVQKAYQDIRNYSGLSGVPIPGHGPAIGCRLPFGIPKGWKPTRPPHSLKLGSLPCFLTPPSGILTPEADIPTP